MKVLHFFYFFFFTYTGVLFGWSLILYGTETDPIKGNSHIYSPLANTPPTVTLPKEPIPTAIPGHFKLHKYKPLYCFIRNNQIKEYLN